MREIVLTHGKVALVDDEDLPRVESFAWYARHKRGVWYAISTEAGRMHRLILDAPDGVAVDHVNGDGLDNRKENLRLCTHAENMRNARKRCKGSSKYKGVYYQEQGHNLSRPWRAQITIDRELILLGAYSSEGEAAEAYNAAAIQYFGQFCCLNAIDPHDYEPELSPSYKRWKAGKTTSRYRGVSRNKQNKNPWSAYIQIDRRRYHLGTYASERAAAIAYNEAVLAKRLDRPLNEIDES